MSESIASEPLGKPDARQWHWLALGLIVAAVCLGGGVVWVLDHPYPTGYDEPKYLNGLHGDAMLREDAGFLTGLKHAYTQDRMRPPASRVATYLHGSVFGLNLASARLLSGLTLILTLPLLCLAARRVAGPAAGWLALILIVLTPQVLSSSFRYGTEFTLLLGIAITFYTLARGCTAERVSAWTWAGLGVGLALGMYAKFSFVVIAGPMFAVAVAARLMGRPGAPPIMFLVKASITAMVLLAPWYGPNMRRVLSYAKNASSDTRTQLASDFQYGELLAVNGLGWPVTAMIVVMVVVSLILLLRAGLDRERPAALTFAAMMAAAALPTLLLHVIGNNHNIRFVAPVVPPLMIAVVCLAGAVRGVRWHWVFAGTLVVAVAQLVFIVFPVVHTSLPTDPDRAILHPAPAFRDYDQWDWSPLREYANALSVEDGPVRIAYLGNGGSFNQPQIKYAWVQHGEKDISVSWLWRFDYENYKLDMKPFALDWVMDRAANHHLVLTAPGYEGWLNGKHPLDNQHNEVFAEHVSDDPRFRQLDSLSFTTAEGELVEVLVFVNESSSD